MIDLKQAKIIPIFKNGEQQDCNNYRPISLLSNISKIIEKLVHRQLYGFFEFNHSHKKQKDSLEGSLDRVLLAAELEFPKILVPRLPQHTSDVNIECAGKSE